MKLSSPQQSIAHDSHRFKVVIAGRRFGKTFLSIRQLCFAAKEPNREVFYITSSYRSAKMIVWKPLKRRLLDLRWAAKVNESELSITLKNGSTISLKGAENPDSLRGPSLSYCVIDEMAEVDPDLWFEVIRPALADQQGGALFIGTPKGKGNWSYDLFTMEEQHTDWKSFQFRTIDGGWVKPEEIEAARQELDARTFRQEFEATFETFEGTVAYNFSREHNIKTLPAPDVRTLHIGMDFNTSPVTAAVYVQQGKEMYQIDEVHMLNSNTAEMAQEISRRYPTSKIICYPDPAGQQRKTSASGATDFTILRNAGFEVRAPRAHNLVRDRINSYNARLCSSDGIRHLFIDPKCKYTIESLEKFCYKENTQVPDKGQWDHMFDAASYCIDFLFPIKRDRDPNLIQPNRWAHALA
ncbi:phage_term_2, phage terminase, large subunit, PBSX family [uncultured Caudovirales phage]|uniref:Phage_term_2, phage terminase, large subunit, PBSX family n=1 Tax=uncultured Caudovirales phage TaxID=2100421 RepID=A0A6J7X5P7_9CAUD|nr:phage_term_2, phage terminase, large subunit, PBSX family [uncultured Caudovirales phage]